MMMSENEKPAGRVEALNALIDAWYLADANGDTDMCDTIRIAIDVQHGKVTAKEFADHAEPLTCEFYGFAA